MATFTNTTTDVSTITNSSLSGASITFAQDTDTFTLSPGTWDDPFAAINSPTVNTSTITNSTVN